MRVFGRSVYKNRLLVAAATSVVLGWRHVHLILVLSARLYNAGWLPDDLLVGYLSFGATRELGAIGQAKVELAGIELHDIVGVGSEGRAAAGTCDLLGLLAALDVGRLAEVHTVALLGHSSAQLRQ